MAFHISDVKQLLTDLNLKEDLVDKLELVQKEEFEVLKNC